MSASEGAHDAARAPGISSVAPLAVETTNRSWSWFRTVAVASLAAAAALALFMLIPPDVLRTSRPAVAENPTAVRGNAVAPTGPVETAIQKDTPTPLFDNGGSQPSSQLAGNRAEPRVNVPRRPSNRVVPITNASFSTNNAHGSQSQSGVDQTASNEEVTTDFIPLMQGERLQGEGGHLVRVELPRSALERFGLPVNAERGGGGRVKADVLLGEDGLARAIRFVR